jgi:glycosyltransferase involved in cell wall biosynthesis
LFTDILFYKRLIVTGGAEVLFNEHYKYLKQIGQKPLVVVFEIADLDRVNIDQNDLFLIQGKNLLTAFFQLRRIIKKNYAARIICHSGYIELGLASLSLKREYSVFVHQPSSMSFNESDKFSIFYWPTYKKLFSDLHMFSELDKRRAAMSFVSKFYLNFRAVFSQYILKRAKRIFVLSNYAKREKKELFSLETSVHVGAIEEDKLYHNFLLDRLNKENQTHKIVTLSRLDENKRIDILIQAVKALRQDGVDVCLDICGSGPAKEALAQLITSLELDPYIKLLGYVHEDQVSGIYSSADLFATIDWADFRLTTYEALSHRCKVLVSNDTEVDSKLETSGYLFAAEPSVETVVLKINEALYVEPAWSEQDLLTYLTEFTWEKYFSNIMKEISN